jgi:putative DNA primase/helicase
MTGLDDLRPHRLVYRCASEIEMEPVRWIWPGRVALGKHTCIAGEPGTGKSQLTIDLAARVSMGAALPCGEGIAPQGSVIILSAEDGAADTIVPRLHAAGADLGRIVIINSVMTGENGRRGFSLQADLELLEDRIQRLGDARLVIVDPVSSYLAKIDSHKNADVRSVLEPFSEMAERSGVGIVSVTHFSKTGAGNVQKAVHRFIGSIAFIAAPRAAFAVVEDPDDSARHLFLHAKNNLAPPQPGLAFRLKQTIVKEGISASRVDWEPGHVSMSANEAMAAESSSHRKEKPRDAAQTFLRELLADGPARSAPTQRRLVCPAPRYGERRRRCESYPGRRASSGFGSCRSTSDAHMLTFKK